MLFVPYERFVINTPLSPYQVAERIRPIVTANEPWLESLIGKYEFIGHVNEKDISLTPVTKWRYFYWPLITGSVVPMGSGSNIHIVMRPPLVALLIIISFLVFPTVHDILYSGRIPWVWIAGIILLHFAGYCAGFAPEAKRSEKRLRELVARLSE